MEPSACAPQEKERGGELARTREHVPAVLAAPIADGTTVEEEVRTAVGTLMENLVVSRACALATPPQEDGGVISAYVHSPASPGASMGLSG